MSTLLGRRVLIVDDEPFMRNTIRAALKTIGNFNVVEAGDGETALRLVISGKPHLVLCDIGMEPMSGLDFVKALRNQPDATVRDTTVVMLTMHADEVTVQAAVKLKTKGYLLKPINHILLF